MRGALRRVRFPLASASLFSFCQHCEPVPGLCKARAFPLPPNISPACCPRSRFDLAHVPRLRYEVRARSPHPGPAPSVITDPLFFLVAVPAVLCLGLSKGGFAGVGMVSTPLMALVLPPLQAAALLLPILILQDAISVWVYRRDWVGWNLKVMLPVAVVGVCIACLLAAHVSDAFIRLLVGLIGVAFVLNAWFARAQKKEKPPSAASGMFWGSLSGFTSTLSQAGSPPFQVHVLPQRLPKLTLVGTTTLFFAAVNAMKVVPYLALGQFSEIGRASCRERVWM